LDETLAKLYNPCFIPAPIEPTILQHESLSIKQNAYEPEHLSRRPRAVLSNQHPFHGAQDRIWQSSNQLPVAQLNVLRMLSMISSRMVRDGGTQCLLSVVLVSGQPRVGSRLPLLVYLLSARSCVRMCLRVEFHRHCSWRFLLRSFIIVL
jgi:hypothetical protein